MNTRSPKPRSPSFDTPYARHASLDELRRRAVPLRFAIAHDHDLKRVVDAFYDGFSTEMSLYEHSCLSYDPSLHAVLDSVCSRFPGEVIEKRLCFSEELGLFHGGLRSSRRVGCVFQFAGDTQGVIAVSPLGGGANTDFFRFTLVHSMQIGGPAGTVRGLANTFSSRGGSA